MWSYQKHCGAWWDFQNTIKYTRITCHNIKDIWHLFPFQLFFRFPPQKGQQTNHGNLWHPIDSSHHPRESLGNPWNPPQDSSPTDSALWDDPWTPDMGKWRSHWSDSSHVYIISPSKNMLDSYWTWPFNYSGFSHETWPCWPFSIAL